MKEDVNFMTVQESLRKIRKAHKLTQQDVATVLGVDRTTYTLYETGSTNPSIEVLDKLSVMYNATIGYILGKEENNHTERLHKVPTIAEESVDPIAHLSKEERMIVLSYRVLSDEKKEELQEHIKEFLKKD